MRLKLLLAVFLISPFFMRPVLAQSLPYIKSASAGNYFGDSTVTPSESDVYNASLVIAQSLKTKMGSEPVRAVIMLTNAGYPAKTVEAVKSVFGANTQIFGAATGSAKYQPLSIDFFPPPLSKHLSLTAIGGSAITSITQADDGAQYGYGGDDAKITAGTKAMALKLTPNPNKKNLLLLTGPGHWDNNVAILAGVKQAWGDPLPSYIKVIGMGSADGYAASIVNGIAKGGTVNAILLSGDFNIASRGVGEGFGGDPVLVTKNLLNQIKTELNGNADILFYVPGHPQEQTGYTGINPAVMYQNMRQTVIDVFGNVSLVGHHASSETGQKLTNSPAEAVKYTFYAVGIKAGIGPTNPPDPTVTLSPTPTLGAKPGDANGDGKADGLDYVIWLINYNKTVASGVSSGDFNKNGIVDGLDYVIWLNNYNK